MRGITFWSESGPPVEIPSPIALKPVEGIAPKFAVFLEGLTLLVLVDLSLLNSILEVLRVHKDEMYKVNQKDVIKLRDKTIPLVSIDDILTISRNGDVGSDYQNVVIVKIADKSFGIKVDELIGQKEVVIKSLGSYLGNLEGIAGSTIMGDGTVVMILDLSELMNQLTA